MIRLNFAGRIHRVYITANQRIGWGAYAGGSGDILGYNKPVGEIPPPSDLPDGKIVGGLAVCPERYTDGDRLTFEARWDDGKTREVVYHASEYHLLQEWRVFDTEPAEWVPPQDHTVDDIVKLAVAATLDELVQVLSATINAH